MPEEEESNRPKLIVPGSEGNKSQNRLLVPPSDQEAESSSPKPQLVAPIDQAEEPQAEEPQAEEPQAPGRGTPGRGTPGSRGTPGRGTPTGQRNRSKWLK